jgi:hypothetical protein
MLLPEATREWKANGFSIFSSPEKKNMEIEINEFLLRCKTIVPQLTQLSDIIEPLR